MEFIADFCQNHNGDFELLKDMVHAAKEAGATYGKIQTIFADQVSYRERFEKGRVENGKVKVIKRPYSEEVSRLSKLELNYDQQANFVALCEKVGLRPLTTVFTTDSVKKIKSAGFKEIKVASYDCASPPLLNACRENFTKTFVSTGATYDHEIEEAAKVLAGSHYVFLHCVTLYPTPLTEFHLSRMDLLKQFSDSVGYSDHSDIVKDGIKGTVAALFLGANVIERHFSILPVGDTKDGIVSVTPAHVKELMSLSKSNSVDISEYLNAEFPNFRITMGESDRTLSEAELLNRDYFRGRFCSKAENGKQIYNWETI